MNVFEDLVIELKEENLLERTVIDDAPYSSGGGDIEESKFPDLDEEPLADEFIESDDDAIPAETAAAILDAPKSGNKKPRNGTEFYRKRAVSEVSNLQMVEHVLTGVEREFMKIVPNAFDDIKAKRALHTFLNVDENENSTAHSESEFTLMQETEAWCAALAERDQKVPVSSLRQFCENSRPALSSQALLALARFYRNLPFSENVRSKFDFVITRLFSKPDGNDKRAALFARQEATGHINTLYSDWSSIALYSAENDESKLVLAALSFDDLATEAESAPNFDQLIESEFFGRVRLFKESISELFYAPVVVAAAIEGNVRIGNAYVHLLEKEHEKIDAETIQSKYSELNDHEISDAAGRTLALVEILRDKTEEETEEEPETATPVPEHRHSPEILVTAAPAKPHPRAQKNTRPFFGNFIANAKAMNKWFLLVAGLVVAASVGLYIWSNLLAAEEASTIGVQLVEIENTTLKEHVKTARISGETFYAFMLPSWDLLPKAKREEFLKLVLKSAQEKGCRQVTLTDKDGKNAGYASATRLEVEMP